MSTVKYRIDAYTKQRYVFVPKYELFCSFIIFKVDNNVYRANFHDNHYIFIYDTGEKIFVNDYAPLCTSMHFNHELVYLFLENQWNPVNIEITFEELL